MFPLGFSIVVSKPGCSCKRLAFNLRVKRLNHVKLFYVFLLRFAAKAARRGVPPAGTHSQATYRGGRLWPEGNGDRHRGYRPWAEAAGDDT
ncbi:hypothetical protein BHM03_00015386 [Ensete ventricosum]|nr:hypothetical protein BHM03_00015386 [Ensete ventricosum]